MSKLAFILFSVASAMAILVSLIYADLPLAIFFHERANGWLARLAFATTDGGLAGLYLAGSAISFLVFQYLLHRKAEAHMAAFLFASVAFSGIVTDILKVVFGRTRPKLLFRDDLYQFHGFKFGANWNSFPSGHSTSVAAAMLALCLIAPRWKGLFIPFGLALIATRIITTAHYLSDTLCGFYIGTTVTLWAYGWFRQRGWLPVGVFHNNQGDGR